MSEEVRNLALPSPRETMVWFASNTLLVPPGDLWVPHRDWATLGHRRSMLPSACSQLCTQAGRRGLLCGCGRRHV
jgi:hypothetical protein